MKTTMNVKKLLALTLVLTVILTAFAGCANTGPTQEEYNALLVEIETLQTEVDTLRTTSEELQTEIDRLLEENGEMTDEITVLVEALEAVEATLTEAEETLDTAAAGVEASASAASAAVVPTSSTSSAPVPAASSQAPTTSQSSASSAASSTAPAASSGSGVFAGYSVTVKDKITPAVDMRSRVGDNNTMCFLSASGVEVGSISRTNYLAVIKANETIVTLPSGAKQGMPPGGGDDWNAWLAQQFNAHRGVSGSASSNSSNSSSSTSSNAESGISQQVIELINKERTNAGLPELSVSSNLNSLALVRAEECATSFSHTRPNGANVTDDGCIENLHRGSSTASGAVNSWMNSRGHRETILSSYEVSVGAAYYKSANGSYYWVAVFSAN